MNSDKRLHRKCPEAAFYWHFLFWAFQCNWFGTECR